MSDPSDREKIVATEFRKLEAKIAGFDVAKVMAAKNFESDPLHFISRNCSSIIRVAYEAGLAAYLLEAPYRNAEFLLMGLWDLHRRELSAQLSFCGGCSSSAFSNAVDSELASARGWNLSRGFLSKEYIGELTASLGLSHDK
jgi:hypothetical protein